MTKLAPFLLVCLVVLFTAAISADRSFKMDFVGEFRAGRPAIFLVSTTDMDLTKIITVGFKSQTGDDADKTHWDFSYGQSNIASNMNQDVLQQNNFNSNGDSVVTCVDQATHRPLVNLDYNGGSSPIVFTIIDPINHGLNFPIGNFGSFTFLCPMTVATGNAYAPEFTTLVASQSSETDIDVTLAPPAAWSWREPIITLNSASYSANTGNLLGGKIKFQFSTDTAGIHRVSVRNGPQVIYYNRRNQDFTSYQCGDNVEAYILWGNSGGLEIHVKDSAANGASITCTVDVDGYMSSAFTKRSQVVIEMDTVLVAQGIDFPVLDATFTASVYAIDGSGATFNVNAFDLSFSASPLHTNSTVEIRFTGIDVNTMIPTNSTYRANQVCPDLGGTFSQDSKSVFIKDISNPNGNFSNFACTLNFVGSKIVRLDELTPVPTVQVLVDGVLLYNRAARSTSFPLYLPVTTEFNIPTSKIYQDDSTIKHVVEFSLQDQSQSYGIVPQQPILVLTYESAATWATANYANMLSCEATSPSSSVYQPLVMTFDLERRTWTADLSDLVSADAFQVNFRCTRSEDVVKKFDIVQNTPNTLSMYYFDVVSGKNFNYQENASVGEIFPKKFLQLPTTPTVPTDFTQYFSFSGSVFITDFATMTSVVDDASTKILAAIKAGYDAYDAQTPAPSPLAQLNPTFINKAYIEVGDNIVNSSDYSPSFAQIMYNLFYNIIGNQFQQIDVQSVDAYGPVFSQTGHQQVRTPFMSFSQFFTSGSTDAQIEAYTMNARLYAQGQMRSAFYKDAFSTSPAVPLTFSPSSGFQFPSISQPFFFNPIIGCGCYEVGYAPSFDQSSSTHQFVYADMINNGVSLTYTCRFGETCSADADCDSGYCANSICAVMKPKLKYPYVQYNTVADFPEYNGYNVSIVASLSVVIVAMIIAIVV